MKKYKKLYTCFINPPTLLNDHDRFKKQQRVDRRHKSIKKYNVNFFLNIQIFEEKKFVQKN